jgi:hypothetical protein
MLVAMPKDQLPAHPTSLPRGVLLNEPFQLTWISLFVILLIKVTIIVTESKELLRHHRDLPILAGMRSDHVLYTSFTKEPLFFLPV